MIRIEDALLDAQMWFADLAGQGIDLTGNAHLKVLHEATEFAEDPSLEEAADVLISLLGAIVQQGRSIDSLAAAVRAKMAVNRARTWHQLEDGTYQHV
jgi:predicted house-cleaning noncanonical NTP pyrophosphatase (MazG superfamily)